MTIWLDRNITNLTEDVLDTFLNVDENRNISDQTEDVLKTVNVDEKLKGMSLSDEHLNVNGIKTQKINKSSFCTVLPETNRNIFGQDTFILH